MTQEQITVTVEETKPLAVNVARRPTRPSNLPDLREENGFEPAEEDKPNPFVKPRKPSYGKEQEQKGALNLPQQVTKFFEQQGYTLSWVRALLQGQPDTPNIVSKMRKGYDFVKPEHFAFGGLENTFATEMNVGDFRGVLVYGDLVLMMIPTEVRQQNTAIKHARALQEQEDTDTKVGLGTKIRGIKDINESSSQSENLRFKKR
jgi:hypothetical protein